MRVLLFPGQSSRYPEMLSRALTLAPACAEVVRRASEVLGRDLLALDAQGETGLQRQRDIQVGVFVANHLHLTAFEAHGGRAERSLGLSLGEYNHLVHIGALSFEDALRVVDARGRLYDEGPAGMMAAVHPIPVEELEALLEDARPHGVAEVGNYNSPTQHVVSGERAAVERVIASLEQRDDLVEGAVIERQIPMHSTPFKPVGERLREVLERAEWRAPHAPYHPNLTGVPMAAPRADDFIDALSQHAWRPVRWRQSLEWLASHAPSEAQAPSEVPTFAEVGPRAVLFNLLQKGWLTVRKHRTDDPKDPVAALKATAEALRDVA